MAVALNWLENRRLVLEECNQGWPEYKGNQVYMDIVIGGKTEQTMRLVFALFLNEVPLAAANFHALCTQRFGGLGDAGSCLTYRDSRILRVVKGQFLQGGDITSKDGSGGDSIYGSRGFEDEALGLRMAHNGPGLLSMANRGPDTNQSQFLITLGPAPELDGTHVIFGRLVSGAMHLPTLESVPVDANDVPLSSIIVVESGVIPEWKISPLPLPEEKVVVNTIEGLGSQADESAEEMRKSVQQALSQALSGKRSLESEESIASKRSQPSSSSMLALPFADEDDSSGNEDEDESE